MPIGTHLNGCRNSFAKMHYRLARVAIFNAAEIGNPCDATRVMLAEARALVDVSLGLS